MSVLETKGHIVFDASAVSEDNQEIDFGHLVKETLESSEYIRTEWYDMDGHPDDVLLVQEVKE